MSLVVFTIGHSTHPVEHFIGLLELHRIDAVADVRSSPYSKLNPQFNREDLSQSLEGHEIHYVFLGQELGARSADPACYVGEQVQYDRLAETKLFGIGIDRVKKGAMKHRVALVCSEKEPIQCHRTILVSRRLIEQGLEVRHVLEDGSVETHAMAMTRLMQSLKMAPTDLFRTEQELLTEAYERQASKIAYRATPQEESRDKSVLGRAEG